MLAAGAGTRFRAAGGGLKLLAPYAGRPLLEGPLRAAAEAGLAERVVVLGHAADEILAAVDLHGARPVLAPRWGEGMAASLHAGLEALDPATEGVVILLGDGPRLASEAVRRVAAAFAEGSERMLAASYGGRRGHPVALARGAWASLPQRGEAGGRALGDPDRLVPCDDLEPPGDADVPAALA